MKKRDMAVATHLLQKKVEVLEAEVATLRAVKDGLEDIVDEIAEAHYDHALTDVREYAGLLLERFKADFGIEPDPPMKKCLRCGHRACPHCETWCDILGKVVRCPFCHKVAAVIVDGPPSITFVDDETGERDEGVYLVNSKLIDSRRPQLPCLHCKEVIDCAGDVIEVSLCCGGECVYEGQL